MHCKTALDARSFAWRLEAREAPLGGSPLFIPDGDRFPGGSPACYPTIIEANLNTVAETSRSASIGAMRPVPFRFIESWLEAGLGFVSCVILPIYVYAPVIPFAGSV